MFVTAEDFDISPYNLSGLDKVSNSFPDFVDQQEEAELSKLLGVRFWEAFKAGVLALPADWISTTDYAVDTLVVSGSKIYKSLQTPNLNQAVSDAAYWVVEPDNRWLLLKVGGLTYTYEGDGKLYKWAGMKALVKPMINSLWVRTSVADRVSSIAVVKAKAENSDVVSANVRICRMWNEYDSIAFDSRKRQFYAVRYQNTLFGYLVANATDFDADVVDESESFLTYLYESFTPPGRQNIFDL